MHKLSTRPPPPTHSVSKRMRGQWSNDSGKQQMSTPSPPLLHFSRDCQEHDYMEELQAADRMVDTISVEQTANSTYSINQVLAGGFDTRANVQVHFEFLTLVPLKNYPTLVSSSLYPFYY